MKDPLRPETWTHVDGLGHQGRDRIATAVTLAGGDSAQIAAVFAWVEQVIEDHNTLMFLLEGKKEIASVENGKPIVRWANERTES